MRLVAKLFLGGVVVGLLLFGPSSPRLWARSRAPRAAADKELPKLRLSRNERAELSRILVPFIETVFREGRVAQAIERDLRPTPLSSEEAKAVDKIAGRGTFTSEQWKEFLAAHKDARTISRAFAVSLEYEEFLATLLWVGTVPLPKSEFCVHFHESESAVEAERKRVLAAHGISEEDFYSMLGRMTPEDVNRLEAVDSELINFIKRKTDKRIFEGNLALMKARLVLEKRLSGRLAVYVAYFAPIYQAIFVREGGRMRMIAFGDVADSC